MCTRILWTGKINNQFSSICGRNMDWASDMKEKLWFFPAGLSRKSHVTGNALTWVSKYASISTIVYDQATSDGMNQEGLGVHANWLTESYYGKRDNNRPGLDGDIALQYFLDNFATVKEVVDDLNNKPDLQFVPTQIRSGSLVREIQCHLAIEDAKGESAIVEYLKNGDSVERNIYYSGDLPALYAQYVEGLLQSLTPEKREEYKANYLKAYNVLTNSPPFKEQLKNLKNYQDFGGTLELPGDTDAAARFVRGAYYLINLPEPPSQREAIAYVLSLMRSTAQPFRKPGPHGRQFNTPYDSSTQWRTVADLTKQRYIYESSVYPTLIWLNFEQLKNFSDVRVFDLTQHREVIGDVSERLTSAEDPFGKNLP